MSEILLTRNGDGKITGLTEPDARAWARCFLWPQLDQAERQQTIEAVLMEFEQ